MKSTTFILPRIAFAGIASYIIILSIAIAFVASLGKAAVVEHTFEVGNITLSRLCKEMTIMTVNDQYPGPTIDVTEGDTVVVHVINKSPHELSIHWHGVIQMLNNWADGAGMITQCPIQPGNNFTYRFTVSGQEGTLWWHAHIGMLRVSIHGALIIRPKDGMNGYPFSKPDGEATIIIGEWWEGAPWVVEDEYHHDIFNAHFSEAYVINGKIGDGYPCSSGPQQTYMLQVEAGKSYLLRMINSALVQEFFFEVANHSFKVVAVDASYTNPYETNVIVIGPGQTIDAILVANAPIAQYYMATWVHHTFPVIEETNTSTALSLSPAKGIVKYANASSSLPPVMPSMPDIHDHMLAYNFNNRLTSLMMPTKHSAVPLQVDTKMFITIGLAYSCLSDQSSCNGRDKLLVGHMNNVSLVLPKKMSLLEAHYSGAEGIYTTDFPDKPSLFYNFTDPSLNSGIYEFLNKTSTGTKVKRLKYNTTVELVLQGVNIVFPNRHNMHLHGHNFYLLALGLGSYEAEKATKNYNLIDPPMMNTISVPPNGWAVIRFVANNPGVWAFHCHVDMHYVLGMGMAFLVEDGPTQETSLPPPPADLPRCPSYETMEIDDMPSIAMDNTQ